MRPEDMFFSWNVKKQRDSKNSYVTLSASYDDVDNQMLLKKEIIIANGKVISDINRAWTTKSEHITRNLVVFNTGVIYERYAYRVFDIDGNLLYTGEDEPSEEDVFYYTMSSGGMIYPSGRNLNFDGILINGEQFVYETWGEGQP